SITRTKPVTLTMLHRELLLWRKNQRMASVDCEVEDGKRVPDRYADNAGAVNRIGELEANCNERYDHCQSCPDHAEGTAIWPFDVGELAPKLNKTQPLKQVEKHSPVPGHVEKHTADKRLRRLPTHVEPYNEHDGESE